MKCQESFIHCPGCRALFPDVEGPTHRYLGACAGCWTIYGEVLAREYSDPRYGRVHHLTVDAYSVQHPGKPSPQTIQSIGVHLISLYLALETDYGPAESPRIKRRSVENRELFQWLDPPSPAPVLTILDIHAAQNADEHADRVRRWCHEVWEMWSEHHAIIREWAAAL